MTPARSGQAGFTLVEVLLALLIAGLVMVGSYSVASQVMRLSEEAAVRLETESARELVRLALANDLGSVIYVDKAAGAVRDAVAFLGGAPATSLSGQTDTRLLSLATAATLDPGQPFPSHGFNRVEYRLRQDETLRKDKQASLVRRERVAATVPRRAGQEERWNETVLLARVENPDIRFAAGSGDEAASAWDSLSRERGNASPLPAQVRLTGVMVVSGQRFPLDVRVNLPARALFSGGR
ncbi:prepilin-type N-terminal cleavage/methylation domain-containing protein [Solidesulfovibrio sp.]|uniref:PulJ/GspJ family protein n=1 Tax=Solidesulfovibrio sp. TaxID=2910990 RepID=UPI00262D4A5E|nr:prepilin-type N-terminal cleavage/methylation domain-containing protein [Solidesulfovibrio sp.]